MEDELVSLLEANKIFSVIPSPELHKLATKFTRISLKKNEILFKQGDTPDYVYIIASGKLTVLLKTGKLKSKIMDHIEAGDVIGEVSALGDNPHPMTVKGSQDTVLYRLSRKEFLDLSYSHPAMIFACVRPVISRVQQIVHSLSPGEKNKRVALLPANNKTTLEKFAATLIPLIQEFKSLILISDFLPEFSKLSVTKLREKIHYLETHKKSTEQIIFLLQSYDSHLAAIALEKSETVYLMSEAKIKPYIANEIRESLTHKKTHYKEVVTNLVLLHSKQTQQPKNTASWLQEFPFHLHHHVKMDVTRHFKRLIRFIRGRANGLVLSGGGTRGFAHLGAIKALREEKIPLDFIGGTSVGAIVGGAYAMQESYQDAYQKFNEIVTASSKSVAWSSLTWPIISLFNGKFFTDILYKVFNKHQIEDLWIPYFCISSNLANYSEEIHQNGSLFEKTRASASIPGIIPPMIINGEIHFDGGLLNNLPVDIMRQFLGKKAKIIAIELTASMHDLHKYQFPPVLTFKETLMIKMHLLKQHFIFPRFVDIFIRGLLMGSSVRSRQNGLSATILVNLSLRKFRLLQTTPKQSAKMLEIGYLETLSKIQHYKNKDS